MEWGKRDILNFFGKAVNLHGTWHSTVENKPTMFATSGWMNLSG